MPDIGQIETDEVYVGLDHRGAHYIFPLQAKGGKDRVSIVQVEQDLGLCRKDRFAVLTAVPLAAHFNKEENTITLFAFEKDGEDCRILSEKHYMLVPHSEMTAKELDEYRGRLAGGACALNAVRLGGLK